VTKNTNFLNTDEAAKFLGKAPATLVIWRSTKRYGLPYIKMGGSVRYAMDDLLAFVEAQRVEPTTHGER
jgi:Helix-turn-helix domain